MKKKRATIKKKIKYFAEEKILFWMSFLIVCSILFSIKFSGEIQLYYSQKVEDKVLTAYYDEDAYVVEGLPKMVDVVLEGNEMQVKSVATKNEFNAVVDLKNLSEGQHIVPIEIKSTPKNVIAEADPQNVSILIKQKVSRNKPIQIDYINKDKLDPKNELGDAVLSTEEAVITGAKDVVEKVVSVKAIVDVSDTELLTEYEAPLYAMAEDGTRLDLQIEPNFITVTIPTDTPSKTVPFNVSIEGLPGNKAVESISLSEKEVTVFAPKKVLASIAEVKVLIPYDKIKDTGEVNLEMTPPQTITEYSVTKLNVKASIVDKAERVLTNVPVELKNVPIDLAVESSPVTNVKLKGAQSVIERVQLSDIALFADAKTLKVGANDLPVLYESLLSNVEIIVDNVKININ